MNTNSIGNKITKNNVVRNTTMLYVMNIAKLILPLVTLPYLTRVLSVECYGVVSYVKNMMLYMQLIVDFGFLLSETKEVVRVRENKDDVGKIVGNTLVAKAFLSFAGLLTLFVMILNIPLLKDNSIYTLLSYVTVVLSIFLLDFLFQGLEKMEVIAIRFIVMKGIATALTFVFVHNDRQILWIPILDIIGSLVAVAMVAKEVKKEQIKIRMTNIKEVIRMTKKSAMYFASDMATTTFGALNTLLIGIYMNAAEVAYWNVAMQIVMAIQSLYNPITNGIYPEMVKNKNFNLVKKVLFIFMPIIFAGCVLTYFMAPLAIQIVGGAKYIEAATPALRALIPVLFLSFPTMLLGWPTLGAIDKVKETTATTVITAVVQIMGICALIYIGRFHLIEIALLRGTTELLMMSLRGGFCWKHRKLFSNKS